MKIFSVLVLITVLGLSVLPLVANAQEKLVEQCTLIVDLSDVDTACTKGATVSALTTKAWGMCCALNAVYKITNWIFIVLVFLAVIFFLIGAYTLITAAGDPTKVASGRNYILYAIIGLAVAFLARAVPSVAKAIIGA